MTTPITREQVKEAKRTQSAQLVSDYLGKLRGSFYGDNQKGFFQQRRLLIQAITTPARWANKKGVELDDRHCRKILDLVIKDIQHHGNLSAIKYFCRYFLDCVQKHLQHHEEEYLDLGRKIREGQTAQVAKSILDDLTIAETSSDFTERLSDLFLDTKKSRPKKPRPEPQKEDNQLGLL